MASTTYLPAGPLPEAMEERDRGLHDLGEGALRVVLLLEASARSR